MSPWVAENGNKNIPYNIIWSSRIVTLETTIDSLYKSSAWWTGASVAASLLLPVHHTTAAHCVPIRSTAARQYVSIYCTTAVGY